MLGPHPDYVDLALAARADETRPDHRSVMSVDPYALASVRWMRASERAWRCQACGQQIRLCDAGCSEWPSVDIAAIHYRAFHASVVHIDARLRDGRFLLWKAARLFAEGNGYDVGDDECGRHLARAEVDDLIEVAKRQNRAQMRRELELVVRLADAVGAGQPGWQAIARVWPPKRRVPDPYHALRAAHDRSTQSPILLWQRVEAKKAAQVK